MDQISDRPFTSTETGEGQTLVKPLDDLLNYLREYARERPGVTALWAFGIGFILGWRLKPW
jgi:hypothetical protein